MRAHKGSAYGVCLIYNSHGAVVKALQRYVKGKTKYKRQQTQGASLYGAGLRLHVFVGIAQMMAADLVAGFLCQQYQHKQHHHNQDTVEFVQIFFCHALNFSEPAAAIHKRLSPYT